MTEDFQQEGCTVIDVPEAASWSAALEAQHRAILNSGAANRPWIFWELHNPWGRSAAIVDSWQILDICQAPAMLDCLSPIIGEDLVLFDSQIVPNPTLAEFDDATWRNDEQFFPLDDDGGIVVRLPFGSATVREFEYRQSKRQTIEFSQGQVLIHEGSIDYRSCAVNGSEEQEFLIRYFPADKRFNRDPQHPKHVQLTNRYPWVNYAKMPLWLARGEDVANNDFVTGFHTKTGRWTTARAN